jgi:hypothetical protein
MAEQMYLHSWSDGVRYTSDILLVLNPRRRFSVWRRFMPVHEGFLAVLRELCPRIRPPSPTAEGPVVNLATHGHF